MNISLSGIRKIREITRDLVFKKSLGRTLASWFIAISLVPIVVISIINDNAARQRIIESSSRQLSEIVRIKNNEIKKYFNNLFLEITYLSREKNTIESLKELRNSFIRSRLKIVDFIKSPQWNRTNNQYCQGVVDYRLFFGFHDVFLIDSKGNILYSVERESDFGTNIFTGKYSDTKFAQGCREAFEEEKITFTDFEEYSPSNHLPAAFIITVIFDENRRKIGLLALQVKPSQIDTIMQQNSGLGKRGETYLIGTDFLMRSNSILDDEFTFLEEEVKTHLAMSWYNEHVSGEAIQKGSVEASIYTGPRDVEVIGIHYPINIMEIPMAIVAEIETSELFSNIEAERFRNLVLMIIAAFSAIILSFIITNRIVNPIKNLKSMAKRFAVGDIEFEEIEMPDNEIGELHRSFRDVIEASRKIVFLADSISMGDLSTRVEMRSDLDVLGVALQRMTETLRITSEAVESIADGNMDVSVALKGEKDRLAKSINRMAQSIKEYTQKSEEQNWLTTGQSALNESMLGNQNVADIAGNIITFLSEYLDALVGVMYIPDEEGILQLMGSYAYTKRRDLSNKYAPGEGLVGQAMLEKKDIILANPPEDYIWINSGLGKTVPGSILVTPVILNDIVVGVIELGKLDQFTDLQMQFIEQVKDLISIALNSAKIRTGQISLLHETQRQADELQAQQEELRAVNEELEDQTIKLRGSEEELKAQSEELIATNQELEEKTHVLEEQKESISRSNTELENARQDLEQKARELETSSKYKSEFLANMSHELRTPLNSLLILSQDLAANKNGNLSDDQVQSSEIVHKSGNELLVLINDILDLSKIEAGKMTLEFGIVSIKNIINDINSTLMHLAEDKGLQFDTKVESGLPENVFIDYQKFNQIIRNLVSNAVKFTHEGGVTVKLSRPDSGVDLSRSGLDVNKSIAVSVTDTGIGIPEDKHLDVFEAFQQVDGSTSREYGGTGLGLSISRNLAKLIGGEIQLKSKEGKGSTFTLYLPEIMERREPELRDRREESSSQDVIQKRSPIIKTLSDITEPAPSIDDDRGSINPGDRSILVIEDDLNFAQVLINFCHERNFKFIHAGDGENGLKLAKDYKPDAIILDIRLPGIDGWSVLEFLKDNPELRHIPVHIMSVEDETIDAFMKGALGYLNKPIDKEKLNEVFSKIECMIEKSIKDLLIAEHKKDLLKDIVDIIGNGDVKVTTVDTGRETIEKLSANTYDCMILDLELPDMSGFEVLQELSDRNDISCPPVIVYTGKEITKKEEREIEKYADSIVVRSVKSVDHLLDETALFLHRIVNNLPENKRKIITKLHDTEALLKDKNILLVDDDMRNVFAVSKVLSDRGMNVFKAANGKSALDVLEKNPDINLVLMDIMMPVMDGYEAMRRIRKQKRFRKLPILALTAKAMKEDRGLCIEAGANDYIAKPVDVDKMMSLMRVWLYK